MFENTFERIKELYRTHKIDENGLNRAVAMNLITVEEKQDILTLDD